MLAQPKPDRRQRSVACHRAPHPRRRTISASGIGSRPEPQDPGDGQAQHAQIVAQIAARMLRQAVPACSAVKNALHWRIPLVDDIAHPGEAIRVRPSARLRAAGSIRKCARSAGRRCGRRHRPAPSAPRQRREIGRHGVDDIQRGEAQLVGVRGEHASGRSRTPRGRLSLSPTPRSRSTELDDQDDFAVRIDARWAAVRTAPPPIAKSRACLYQLLHQAAGLDLQLLLEGRILLQGRLELDREPAGSLDCP